MPTGMIAAVRPKDRRWADPLTYTVEVSRGYVRPGDPRQRVADKTKNQAERLLRYATTAAGRRRAKRAGGGGGVADVDPLTLLNMIDQTSPDRWQASATKTGAEWHFESSVGLNGSEVRGGEG